MLMDLGNEATQLGPMMILGMPFFREYYTTFDLGHATEGPRECGKVEHDRSIFVAPATQDCRPASDSGRNLAMDKSTLPIPPRWVDMSKLRVPDYLRKRKSEII